MKQKALITGIRGQDGTLLASHLLEKGYEVHGLDRRSGEPGWRLIEEGILGRIHIHHADLTEYHAVKRVLRTVQPTHIFNLAAQSFVHASFDIPFTTLDVNTTGLLNILEAVRELKLDSRLYQASTSELYGLTQEIPQNEKTPFYPRSPYGISKLAAHWLVINYRESYEISCCAGILFNHESEYRGEEFVTRKVTKAVAEFATGIRRDPIVLGNLDAKRDWGYARDYVEAMERMINNPKPTEYVVATGTTTTVRKFVEHAFGYIGKEISWEEAGDMTLGIDQHGTVVVKTDPVFLRPAEVPTLVGDATRIRTELGWEPKTLVIELIEKMVVSDIRRLERKSG